MIKRPHTIKPVDPVLADHWINDGLFVWYLMQEGSGTELFNLSKVNGEYKGQFNSTVSWIAGSYGSAISGAGSPQYVDIGQLGNFGSQSNSCAFSFWLKTTSIAVIVPYGLQWSGPIDPIFKNLIYINAGVNSGGSGTATAGETKIWWQSRSDENYIIGTDNSIGLNDGNWHHYFLNMIDSDNNEAEIFIDAIKQTTYEQTGYAQGTTSPFEDYNTTAPLLAYNADGIRSSYFIGDLDNFRIYKDPFADGQQAANLLYKQPLIGLEERKPYIPVNIPALAFHVRRYYDEFLGAN